MLNVGTQQKSRFWKYIYTAFSPDGTCGTVQEGDVFISYGEMCQHLGRVDNSVDQMFSSNKVWCHEEACVMTMGIEGRQGQVQCTSRAMMHKRLTTSDSDGN